MVKQDHLNLKQLWSQSINQKDSYPNKNTLEIKLSLAFECSKSHQGNVSSLLFVPSGIEF